jgi:hypothetical protein
MHDATHRTLERWLSAATAWLRLAAALQVGAAGEQVIVDAQGRVLHSHDGLKPHYHEPIYSPGEFRNRPRPLPRTDFNKRSFTIGIGGPVGTGCVRCTHTAR